MALFHCTSPTIPECLLRVHSCHGWNGSPVQDSVPIRLCYAQCCSARWLVKHCPVLPAVMSLPHSLPGVLLADWHEAGLACTLWKVLLFFVQNTLQETSILDTLRARAMWGLNRALYPINLSGTDPSLPQPADCCSAAQSCWGTSAFLHKQSCLSGSLSSRNRAFLALCSCSPSCIRYQVCISPAFLTAVSLHFQLI